MGLLDTQDNSQIMPGYTTATGYGGQPYTSKIAAEESYFPDAGQVTDRETGWVGTPLEILKKYRAAGYDTTDLKNRIGKK